MKLSFVETMRGWLKGPDGAEHPAAFEVSAEEEHGGHFALRGLISAPPWAVEAPVSGTLVIAPLSRTITYHLTFAGPGGARYTLDAQKNARLLAPLRSMSEMPATVRDEAGKEVAAGRMVFDLADLPGFIASWLPVPTEARRLLDTRRRAVERRLLSGA